MRLTHRRLTLVACAAVALIAASASAGSTTACTPGPVKSGGKFWVQYCGPATATAKFSGRTVKFASGRCASRRGVMFLYLGRRIFRGKDPKTKYWEFVGAPKRDGVYRKDVFVEWWLGGKHYILGDIKMTFTNKQRQATYSGKLVLGGKGTATGSFKCSG